MTPQPKRLLDQVRDAIHFTDSKANTTPLILLHGAGGSILHWQSQLRHSKEIRAIAVDLPGHGETKGEACKSLEEYGNWVVKWLDGLGIEKFVVGGISMGGGIAQLIALNYPERITGLVLVATSAKLKVAPQILDGVKNDFEKTVGAIIDWQFSPNVSQTIKQQAHKYLLQVNPEILYADFMACNNFDMISRVNQIKAPTLILVGSADRMTPEKFSHSLAEQIAGSRLKVFPDAGHMLTLERMDETAKEIRDWMLEVGR